MALAGRVPRSGELAVAVISLLAAALFWAGNYVVGAAAVASIDPLSLVLLRWLVALVPLVLIPQLVERPQWISVLRAWPWLVMLSGSGLLLGYNLLLYAALEFTDAFHASLINAFNPALITLVAAVLLRERLTTLVVAGVFPSLAGVLVVLSGGHISAFVRVGFGRGEWLMIGAVWAWTAYTIAGRRAPTLPPITSSAVQLASP